MTPTDLYVPPAPASTFDPMVESLPEFLARETGMALADAEALATGRKLASSRAPLEWRRSERIPSMRIDSTEDGGMRLTLDGKEYLFTREQWEAAKADGEGINRADRRARKRRKH